MIQHLPQGRGRRGMSMGRLCAWQLVFITFSTIACIALGQQLALAQAETASSVLSLRAGVRRTPQATETQLGVVLSLPLADLGGSTAGASASDRARRGPGTAVGLAAGTKATPDPEQRPAAEAPKEDRVEATVDAAAADEPAASLPRALRLSPKQLGRLLRRALALDGSRRRARQLVSLADRSKSAGWLPELSLRAGRSTDQSLRLTPTSADPYRYTQSDGSDVYGEVKLSWRLDRLLFSRDELGIQRLVQSEQARRDQVAERLLSALFDWQLAELRSRDTAQPLEEQLRFMLLAAQARLRLDVLTGGLFGRLVPTPEPSEKEPEG